MSKNNRTLNANVRNVVATSVLTTAFAFTLVTGQASANTDVQESYFEVVQETEVVVEDQSSQEGETTEGSSESETTKEDDHFIELIEVDHDVHTDEEVEVKTPALLPGDLLYFTKQVMENVRLALTFDDVKEAEMLVSLVQERIKEAAALLAEGKEDKAHEVLQKAIDQQELALEKYKNLEEATEEEETEEVTVVEEEAVVIEEDTQEEDQENSIQDELEAKFSSNILALQAALDKVGNAQARESLEKNIVKAQEKLEKKINKRLAKLAEKELKAEELEEEEYQDETAEGNEDFIEATEEVFEDIEEDTDELAKVQEKANKEAAKKAEEKQREEAKQQREAAKKAEEKQREEVKQQREAAKKAEKKQREEAKQQREAAKKAEEKQREEAKQQREAANKAEENKKGKNE
ncbi:DUF5667 domain-containing protein [Halalkalibacter alkalisediminis]|uniref:DUF5667 domain-containing protein n=1 Tax=Halalkalibacter alkalisediminis TaxID=935616 RepID=A0ABV6NJT0_9BACI|nr:DUF5667 domain-containing protein [Halalkalibacter alkalisediminis]